MISSSLSFLRDVLVGRSTWIGTLVLLSAIPALLWITGDWPQPDLSTSEFLVFHATAEIFAVVVAAVIFATGWHIHDQRRTVASIMLACAFLAVGLIDLAHLLSYNGMPDFLTYNAPHKATVFWLAARLVAASALLLYVAMPTLTLTLTVSDERVRLWMLLGSLALAILVVVATIARPHWIPLTIEEGKGLTAFKKQMEYLVVLLHIATLVLLAKRHRQLGSGNGPLLAMAIAISIVSELFFLAYFNVTDLSNAMGHVYKMAAYLFLYRAVFLENVRLPFLRLSQAQRQIEESARRYQQLLETAPDGIVVANAQGVVQMVNQRMEDMFGYSRQELVGRDLDILIPEQFRRRHRSRLREYMDSSQRQPMSSLQNLGAVRKDGEQVPVDISLSSFESDQGAQVTAFVRDVTSWRKLEAELRHLATHDVLTGLPNRALLRDRLQQELAQAARHQEMVAVMVLDLDHFKFVNDSWGHPCGDQLLVLTARRLENCVRQGDTVARLGGDEFALVLPGLKTIEDISAIASKLLKELGRPSQLNGREISGGASLGISLYPGDGETGDELLANADAAMYHAKAEGRQCFCYYTAELNRQTQENLVLQARLRLALERDELELHYQPQVSSLTGEIRGVEALLRWRDAELGNVSPMRFIPVAEASGLILPLGDWVLTTACRQIRVWMDAGKPVRVAVNLSARQFRQTDLVQRVQALLDEHLIPAELLELEVTESALMEDAEAAAGMLVELAELGVQLSVDDFGTGYSSLNYLKMFPINRLKIDRAFVQDIPDDPSDMMIVKTIIGLAHNLGMELVAEGVETQEQLDYLRENGCEECQGYFFSRPVPAVECERFFSGSATA